MIRPRFTISILSMFDLQKVMRCIGSVLLNSRDYQLVLTDNGAVDGIPEYFDALAAQHKFIRVVHNPRNLGFQFPNQLVLAQCTTPYFITLNDDTEVPPGWLTKLEAVFKSNPRAALVGPMGSPCSLRNNFEGYQGHQVEYIEGSCCCAKTDLVVQHGLYSDQLKGAYCLVPETPVLRADMNWVPIGDIKAGDELVSVDEFPPGENGKRPHRRYRRGVVTSTSERMADCVEIKLVDGKSVICSTDHKWLTKFPAPNGTGYKWRMTSQLGQKFRISTPLRTWAKDESFDAGWLSGILDGEGCIRKEGGKVFGVSFSQKEGLVFRRALKILQEMGIPCTYRRSTGSTSLCNLWNVEIYGRRFAMEILGRLRPVRLMQNLDCAWENRSLRSRIYENDIEIESITPVGIRRVISIETTTRTFIANGMVSHNCEDIDLSLRIREAGFSIHLAPFQIVHHRSQTARRVPEVKEWIAHNSAYMQRRWSGYFKTRQFEGEKNTRATLVYIHVPGDRKFDIHAKEFAESYNKNPPGISHDTLIVLNGAKTQHYNEALFKGLPNLTVMNHDNSGWDIGGYIAAARALKGGTDMMLCCGSQTVFHKPGWLVRFLEAWAKHGPGVYGSCATYQIRPHLNTSGFACAPEMLTGYRGNVVTKRERYDFEHGPDAFWMQMAAIGYPVKLVTFSGEYDWPDWRKPQNIYCRGDQSNCVMWFRMNQEFNRMNPAQKQFMSNLSDKLEDRHFMEQLKPQLA